MFETAETLIQKLHPEYKLGTIRTLIVLENPRAVFRVNEIMDELYPYFAGASLGWHDYLGSTARLFKEDANYRIPVKADPNIVIKYIKASHDLLADVVGSRGGIKVGGMYGILPIDTDINSQSFQITLKGFFKDVITQLKRNLSGFWVAHPDFVRLGIALVQAWENYKNGDRQKLETLITSLLAEKYHQEILNFTFGADIEGLSVSNPLYPRSLIVADIKESNFIANNHPDEVRYNVFQSLQYLTDWLCGNGCVALPAQVDGVQVRVMDDLATAERSRWEVWHEIYHNRFSIEELIKIAHEELHFIRKDLSHSKKVVQVKWSDDPARNTAKWYPVAFNIMLHLMTSDQPVEFAPELLLPFTLDSIRNSQDPWQKILSIDPNKYSLKPEVEKLNYYFSICGCSRFAKILSRNLALDLPQAQSLIRSFDLSEILQAASFHGDIGEDKKSLDTMASSEQALVLNADQRIKKELKELGESYRQKFSMKFLISAKGKTASELLEALKARIQNTQEQEVENAKTALWEISNKRFQSEDASPNVSRSLISDIENALKKHSVAGISLCVATAIDQFQNISLGLADTASKRPVKANTWFEMASLSKSLGSCFALEYFKQKNISLDTSVNSLLEKTNSKFRVTSLDKDHPEWANQVTVAQLMNHTALNMHYVNGIAADQKMPDVSEILLNPSAWSYTTVGVLNTPGEKFQYSGGGFMVLEHLLESLEKKSIQNLTSDFCKSLSSIEGAAEKSALSFEQQTLPDTEYAYGYLSDGELVTGTRKMFPAIAAGAMGTAQGMTAFLNTLTKAYHQSKGHSPISHDTAIQMLFGKDKGSIQFMGCKMGLGIFTAEAGRNRFAIHQGANDGFRCLFVHCYQGPDTGKGFSIFCNGDNNGVLLIAEIAQLLLKVMGLEGVNVDSFSADFFEKASLEKLKATVRQEEIVNIGYRDLIFSAFQPDLPEEIVSKGPLDPLAKFNLAVGGKILEVSNQRFARGENLLSSYLPVFDPALFGKQGKIMDSWESVRHNLAGKDTLLFKLNKPSQISFVHLSTKYHFGNQAEHVKVEGLTDQNQWVTLVEKTEMLGHAHKEVLSLDPKSKVTQIKVSMYPDGGLTRLGLFNEDLPKEQKNLFQPASSAKCIAYLDQIPQTQKPMTPKYLASTETVKKNWQNMKPGQWVDVASSAFGGQVLKATNEHYGPAAQVISPFPPLNMFDGLESARSRKANHSEFVLIGLGRSANLKKIEIDFKYFVNNNPLEIMIEGLSTNEKWTTLVARTNVKSYAGNTVIFELPPVAQQLNTSQIKITTFPDGGMNRVKAWAIN